MIDITKYQNDELQYIVYPKLYTPILTDDDYTIGFFTRYFVKKSNDIFITEVNEVNYNQISERVFSKVSLIWKITGPLKNVYVDGKLYERGTYETNLQELNLIAKNMPEIKRFVTDYTQYHQSRKN